ncbi:MAG: flavodoxin family protein, partial [Alphaproteobacteria bacterium]
MFNDVQESWITEHRWDFTDLRAVFLNCTLKPSPEASHTDGLIRIAATIMSRVGVDVQTVRPV